jgi:hypothetical protein
MSGIPDDLFVPVKSTGLTGVITVCTARLPDGTRVGLAFTTPERLAGAMGTAQLSTHLCEDALRGLLLPLGIERIQLDAELVAPAVTQMRNFAARPAAPRPASVRPASVRQHAVA